MGRLNGGIPVQKRPPPGIDNPCDFRFRPGVVDRGRNRQSMNHIAHRPRLDEEQGARRIHSEAVETEKLATDRQPFRQFFRETGSQDGVLSTTDIILQPPERDGIEIRIVDTVGGPPVSVPGLTDTPDIDQIFFSRRERQGIER